MARRQVFLLSFLLGFLMAGKWAPWELRKLSSELTIREKSIRHLHSTLMEHSRNRVHMLKKEMVLLQQASDLLGEANTTSPTVEEYAIEFPPEPRTLIIYSIGGDSKYFHNVDFFLTFGYKPDPNIDFVFVVDNGEIRFENSELGLRVEQIGRICKHEENTQVCAWRYAMDQLGGDMKILSYDWVILLHYKLRGPFMPPYATLDTWIESLQSSVCHSNGSHVLGLVFDCGEKRDFYGSWDSANTASILNWYPDFHVPADLYVMDRAGAEIFIESTLCTSVNGRVSSLEEQLAMYQQKRFTRELLRSQYLVTNLLTVWKNRSLLVKEHVDDACKRAPRNPLGEGVLENGETAHPLEIMFVDSSRTGDTDIVKKFTEWMNEEPNVEHHKAQIIELVEEK